MKAARINKAYWSQKLARNKARDRAVSKVLRRTGWKVIRIWEHRLGASFAVAASIARALNKNHRSPFDGAGGKNRRTK